MSPKDALREMAHISERTWEGTVYTIMDRRYPEYNGRKILVSLDHGKNKVEWKEES